MQTTYTHDFIPPNSLMAIKNKSVANNKPEILVNEKHVRWQELPTQATNTNSSDKQLSKIAESCKNNSEWTGIAPMGILISPRIIPADNTIDDSRKQLNSCYEEQPNKFLQELPNKYPNLYEQLKNTNPDDIQMQTYKNCFNSTYQIDYGKRPEYAKGLYPKQAVLSGKSFVNAEFIDPCAIEDIPVIYN